MQLLNNILLFLPSFLYVTDCFQDGITILEALSATGLRSIRYAKEVPGVKQIIANDISAKAVDSIKKNILDNNVEHLVTASHEDATYVFIYFYFIVIFSRLTHII